jgi:Ca2+-binding RTX toxin-like protein
VSSGSGAEELRGGTGYDVIDGNEGDDVIALGADNDQIIWDPGDGSDTVEGGAGQDFMTFNGAPINETFAAAADGERLRFTRVQGNIVMDTDGVEEVIVNTLGGSDFTEVGDLSGTDVTVVGVDDGLIAGGDGPDAVIDTVSVIGTPRADLLTLTGDTGVVHVQGPSTRVDVVDLSTLDALNVIGDRGADTIDATGVAADAPHLGLLSGPGNDLVLGGAGLDDVLAGPGRDVVDANRGDDRIDLDEGDDEIIWDPGDGSDLVDGAAGFDVMTFNGAGGDEVMEASALDDGLIFTRDLGNIRMDTERLEQLDVNALGGADTLTVGDLSGTTVEIVDLDLAAVRGTPGGDGIADRVVVLGTPEGDIITASGAAGAARIDHLPWSIDIVNSEPIDVLAIDGNGGEDAIDTTGLGPDTIQPAPVEPA